MTLIPLDDLPTGATARSVLAVPKEHLGCRAIEVRLEPEVERTGVPGVDYIDQPTFLDLPTTFSSGTLTITIASQTLDTAPDYARGFAGITFNITDDPTSFEAVYLRPANGRLIMTEHPRNERAVQYFSYPDWPFDRLRDERPNAGYEAGADIRPGVWNTLRVDVTPERVSAEVNGESVISIERLSTPRLNGRIGLFVDIGTLAWFHGLRVEDR